MIQEEKIMTVGPCKQEGPAIFIFQIVRKGSSVPNKITEMEKPGTENAKREVIYYEQ